MKSKLKQLKWYKFDTSFHNVIYMDSYIIGDVDIYFGVSDYVNVNEIMATIITHNIVKMATHHSTFMTKAGLIDNIERMSQKPLLIATESVINNIDGTKLSYKHVEEVRKKISMRNMGSLLRMMYASNIVFVIHDNKLIPIKNLQISRYDNLNFKKSIK